ncbi:MAG TPA: hypothetical protein VMU39_02725 [Solirubrobacteraceae bacterium]|nr:hypothetical protein [Solirubrobacteraceae bacterium]
MQASIQADIEEEPGQRGPRLDIVEPPAAADAAEDRRTFVGTVEAQLRGWDTYLERLQVTAATTGGTARDQAEAAISELRRHRNELGERLSQVRSASTAWSEGRKSVEAARDALEQSAADLAARFEHGATAWP